MKKIAPGFLLPSAAYCINRKQAHRWQWLDKSPEVGDVVYGTVGYLGFHSTLENKQGRIHAVMRRSCRPRTPTRAASRPRKN